MGLLSMLFGRRYPVGNSAENQPFGFDRYMDYNAVPTQIKVDGFSGKTKIDLTKKLGESKHAISLKKSTISLDKAISNLTTVSGIDFTQHRAKVGVVIDKSGSMDTLYSTGVVQNVLLRTMAVALRFDDNGELDVWAMASQSQRLEGMTLDNYDDYVAQNVMGANVGYSTEYAPALQDIYRKYCIEDPDEYPVFIMFFTDGDNSDISDTNKIVRELSKQNVFIVFVGIGGGTFKYLNTLDNLSERECDNTDFFCADDIDNMSDDELYKNMFKRYPAWLRYKMNH